MTQVVGGVGATPPLAATLFGVLGGLVLAALLFVMVCVACVAVLALLHAVLPTGPPEVAVEGEETTADLPAGVGGSEEPAAPVH